MKYLILVSINDELLFFFILALSVTEMTTYFIIMQSARG